MLRGGDFAGKKISLSRQGKRPPSGTVFLWIFGRFRKASPREFSPVKRLGRIFALPQRSSSFIRISLFRFHICTPMSGIAAGHSSAILVHFGIGSVRSETDRKS